MAILNVNHLDDVVYEALKARATQHGVSVEDEVCRILHRGLDTQKNVAELALECFGGENGVDLELAPRKIHAPVEIERQAEILELFGEVDFDPDYDYKVQRQRK